MPQPDQPQPDRPDRSSGTRPQPEGRNAKEPVSKPGGFNNDPQDPENPNEEIERHRRKIRPKPLAP